MAALKLPGQELQADAAGLELLGQRRQFQAAAQPLVSWTTRVTATPETRISLASARALSGGTGGNFLGEDPGDSGRLEGIELGV